MRPLLVAGGIGAVPGVPRHSAEGVSSAGENASVDGRLTEVGLRENAGQDGTSSPRLGRDQAKQLFSPHESPLGLTLADSTQQIS